MNYEQIADFQAKQRRIARVLEATKRPVMYQGTRPQYRVRKHKQPDWFEQIGSLAILLAILMCIIINLYA